MLSRNKYEQLMKQLEKNNFIIEEDCIYVLSKKNISSIQLDFLCRIKLNNKTLYILNKNKNLTTDSIEIYNDYIKRKKEGIRGYKTIKIGYIEHYVYKNRIEYAVKGSDIEGFYWMKDWNEETRIDNKIKIQINEYIESLSSEFIPA